MKTNTLSKMLIAASAIALASAPRAWSAPEALAAQTQPQAEIKTEAIALKHVPPSWMAFWLAPYEIPQPEVSYTREEIEQILKQGTSQAQINAIRNKGTVPTRNKLGPKVSNVFSLPAGVESITPDDATGTLQARGTEEGIARLREISEYLDLPLRRVAVEILSARVNQEDMEKFGLQMNSVQSAVSLGLGFLRKDQQNYRETLQTLLVANRASTLLDVRGSVLNNKSSFFSSGMHSMGAFSSSSSFAPEIDVQLTPTINNDDNVTVVVQALANLPRSNRIQPGANVQTVVNVRDGDTFAVFAPDADKASRLVTLTFVTARIIRRADEKK